MKALEDLAREAGLHRDVDRWFSDSGDSLDAQDVCHSDLARFAALIRAQALDEAAAACASLWRIDGQFSADEFAAEVRALKEST